MDSMKTYEIVLRNYEQLIEQGKVKREEIQRELVVYDFLSKCSEDDLCIMVDSGAFDEFIKSYCLQALCNAELDLTTSGKLMRELHFALDTVRARELFEGACTAGESNF